MTGTFINAGAIVLGGLVAMMWKRQIPAQHQSAIKIAIGAISVYLGLKLAWTSLNGSIGQMAKQLGLVLLAMAVGKLVGKVVGLQKLSNSLGQFATRTMEAAQTKRDFNQGFLAGTALFCAAPLGILGAVHEGLSDFSQVLVVKAI